MPAPRIPAALAGLLLTAACAAVPAVAEEAKPGWVDPPSKVAAPAAVTAKPDSAKVARDAPGKDGPKPDLAAHPAASPRKLETVARTEKAARHPAASVARRETPHRPVRLAIRPAPQPALPAPAPVSNERVVGWAVAAQDLTRDYFSTFSQPNGVSFATQPRFYAQRVVFHGQPMTLAALLAEKRRFFARWPERRYRARPDSIRTACNSGIATCQVDSTVDFVAMNPERGARSQGTVAVRLGVSFADGRPVIVSETSRVISRERVASSAP
ncbi:hypothetical protein [Methylobacterium sp. JK268]